jgi:hypothetical protein
MTFAFYLIGIGACLAVLAFLVGVGVFDSYIK